MVVAFEPSRCEATRERQFHFMTSVVAEVHGTVRDGLVNRSAIVAGNVGDVLGCFQTAFDLETVDACFDHVRDGGVTCQILRAEQVANIAEFLIDSVAHQVIRQPAGLSALPAVRTASAKRFAGQTLAAVGNTQCSVNEGLDGHVRLGTDLFDFTNR